MSEQSSANGFLAALYSDENDGRIPRANEPYWFHIAMRNLGAKNNHELDRIKSLLCPSYPEKRQLVCYAVNGWTFDSANPADNGHATIDGRVYKIGIIQRPVDTIYLADVESRTGYQIFTTNDVWNFWFYDVWDVRHLPYHPTTKAVNPERRVAASRHGKGPNLLYFDGHAALKPARQIVVNDWRDRRY